MCLCISSPAALPPVPRHLSLNPRKRADWTLWGADACSVARGARGQG